MEVGQVSEQIKITAGTPLMQTSDSQIAGTVENIELVRYRRATKTTVIAPQITHRTGDDESHIGLSLLLKVSSGQTLIQNRSFRQDHRVTCVTCATCRPSVLGNLAGRTL